MDEQFFRERIEISRGRQAVVYYWNGYAYKVFPGDYPVQAIRYEIQVQQEVSKTSLPVPKYFLTNSSNIVQMDYIDGVTLTERMLNQGYSFGIEDLVHLQRKVHQVDSIELPYIDDALRQEIVISDYSDAEKTLALTYLDQLGRANNLCHLDFHPSNILWTNNRYVIVDWVNAKRGRPAYDFARTYVILYEVAAQLAESYVHLLRESGQNMEMFGKAVYVMALWRAKEMANEKPLELLSIHDKLMKGA